MSEHRPDEEAQQQALLHPEQLPADGLPERFLTNVASGYAAFAVSAVASVLLTPIFLKHLRAEAFGVSMHCVRWRLLRRLIPELRLRPSLVDRGRIRVTAWLSGWFLLRDLAFTVNFRLDLVVVTVLLGVRQAAFYVVGAKLAKLAFGGLGQVAQVLSPHASALYRNRETTQLEELLIDGTRTTLFVGLPAMVLFTTMAGPIMNSWVGSGYAASAGVLIALATVIGMESLVAPSWEVLEGMGQAKRLALIAVAEAIVNLSCSLVLGKSIGLVGVALGTVIAVAVVKIPATFVLGTREIGIPLSCLVRRAIMPNLLPAASMTAVLLGGKMLLHEDALPVLLLITLVAGLTYLLVYSRTSATPAERQRFRSIVDKVTRRAPDEV